MDTAANFESMLKDAVAETGVRLKETPRVLALYMAERSLHLSAISTEPGFEQAVRAERNNVALRAGIETHAQASAIDFQILGMIQGALRMAAAALA